MVLCLAGGAETPPAALEEKQQKSEQDEEEGKETWGRIEETIFFKWKGARNETPNGSKARTPLQKVWSQFKIVRVRKTERMFDENIQQQV